MYPASGRGAASFVAKTGSRSQQGKSVNRTSWALAAVIASAAAPASAAIVVDQSQWNVVGGFSYLTTRAIPSQSFTAGYDNSVGAGIFLTGTSSAVTGEVTITLYDGFPPPHPRIVGTPPFPVGKEIASGTAIGTRGSWVDVSWARTVLTIGKSYWLGVKSADRLSVAYGNSNGRDNYDGGTLYSGVTASTLGDMTFRTFADDTVAAVPEPATWAMMLAGFGLVGASLRTRRPGSAVRHA
jgi:hypothetical protein